LIFYVDGEKRYIISPVGLKVGDTILSGETAEIKPGNTLPLKSIPTGTMIHNIELIKGNGGKLVRSAGGAAQLLQKKERKSTSVYLPAKCGLSVRNAPQQSSSRQRRISGYSHWEGRTQAFNGWRPTVRGSAMSPRDHPHGGGEGKTPIGMPGPKTPGVSRHWVIRRERQNIRRNDYQASREEVNYVKVN